MQKLNQNIRLSAATMLALLLGSYVFSNHAQAADGIRDISKINSRVSVSADQPVGDVSSVNGSIHVASNGRAGKLKTVNGGIDLQDGAEVNDAVTVNGRIHLGNGVKVLGSLSTVNGSIRAEEAVEIAHSVHSVNGGITFRTGSEVGADLRTVNGPVRLYNTHVKEDVVSSNGNITLAESSLVEGDVIFEAQRRWWGRFFNRNSRRPELNIDTSSMVRGDIHLYREVDVNIADGAGVGEILRHY
jgi:hypothetical protein